MPSDPKDPCSSDTHGFPTPGDTHGFPIPGTVKLIKKTAHHAREYARLVDSFAADLDAYAAYLAKPEREPDDPVPD